LPLVLAAFVAALLAYAHRVHRRKSAGNEG
jgi:hypothetical protein